MEQRTSGIGRGAQWAQTRDFLSPGNSTKQEELTPDTKPQTTPHIRIRHDLRPDVLSFDATHVEFKRWLRDFKTYFTSSGLHGGTIAEQQASLLKCLETDLCNLLIAKTDQDRKIFESDNEEEPCCFDVLMKEFDITHPLTSRRMDLFQMKQGQNEAHPVYMRRVLQLSLIHI